jgi:hypothetical protein
MHLLDVRSCLGGREVYCALDSVEDESNHLLFCVKISISHHELFCRNRFLAIVVVRYRCWGEDGMNTVDGRSSNSWNVLAIFRLGGGITQIIHIHLEELGGRPCLALQRYVHYCHGFFNGIMREGNLVIYTVLRDVSGRLRHRAEVRRALDPSHLNCRWHHNTTWLPRLLGEDIGKVVAVGFLDDETPESVTCRALKTECANLLECPAYNAAVEGAPSQSP